MSVDTIGGFPIADPLCAGCGKELLIENAWMTDGCPCNSRLGINSLNETRWRLLMNLQQQQSRAIEETKTKDQPLVAKIEGQQLVIRIGIDVLAFSAEHCPRLYDYDKHEGPPYCNIINNKELALDVISELNREREDGTTPLHLLLDQAIIDAMEGGSAAFAEGNNK